MGFKLPQAITSPLRLSTTHKGTAFEERSLALLQSHLSMSLTRVGGKSDGGIDLQGWWWLPKFQESAQAQAPSETTSPRRRIRVFAQCKAEQKRLGPKYVREMEGVVLRYLTFGNMSHADDENTAITITTEMSDPIIVDKLSTNPPPGPLVSLLISESSFTKAALLRVQSSPVPFFLLHIPPVSETQETVPESAAQDITDMFGTAFWNPALAGGRNLLAGRMELRWERSVRGGRPALWWNNQKLKNWIPSSVNPPTPAHVT